MAACCVNACPREATQRVEIELTLGFGRVLRLPLLACAADARRMANGGRFRWSASSEELFSEPDQGATGRPLASRPRSLPTSPQRERPAARLTLFRPAELSQAPLEHESTGGAR